MNKKLLKCLVCPQCHHEVQHQTQAVSLDCDVCQLSFPIVDDIPVMLIEQATSLKDVS